MESTGVQTRRRNLDSIAAALPQRASSLGRLFVQHGTLNLSRTEIGVLRSAVERPRRITDLAVEVGVTQPAITLLVNRLAERQWLERRPDPEDRRAVLVVATAAGRTAYDRLCAEYQAFFHEEMAMLSDEEVETLVEAIEILDKLIDRLTAAEAHSVAPNRASSSGEG
jgi:DNA-binding MarR family transcriptional regulator